VNLRSIGIIISSDYNKTVGISWDTFQAGMQPSCCESHSHM